MVVCHCHGVTERAIRKAVRSGACSRGAVTRHCSAGGCCGGCAPLIDEIISRELDAQAEPPLAGLAELSPAH